MLSVEVRCAYVVMSFGAKWKSAREASGLSAQEAGDLAGLHRNTIYDLEKDVEGVTLRVMKRVADVYGVTLGYIFRDDGEPERTPIEFRPLLEPLRPFDQQARERIIRNVASNLGFMASLYAGLAPEVSQPSVYNSAIKSTKTDELEVLPGYRPAAAQERVNAPTDGRQQQRARASKR